MLLGHGIIHRDALLFFFAEVSVRVRYGAPKVKSLRKNRVNLYRTTPHVRYRRRNAGWAELVRIACYR